MYEDDYFAPGPASNDVYSRRKALPPQWQRSLAIQLEAFQDVAKATSILDIGCGEGLFLSLLQEAGIAGIGIEPSRIAVSKGVAAGLQIIPGNFPEDLQPCSVNGINLSHVLEHLADPSSILKSIESVMPSGHVLFTQTSWKGLLPRIQGASWYAWVPSQHYWHFTPAGLTALVERQGWKRVGLWNSSLVHGRRPAAVATMLRFVAPWLLDQFHLLVSVGRS